MFDTHCHLNFQAFNSNVDEVIKRARDSGVKYITIPGTDIDSSRRAMEISQKHENIFAAVGIHPHHIFQYKLKNIQSNEDQEKSVADEIDKLELLINSGDKNIIAIGEIGLDRYIYQKTKYGQYTVDQEFIRLQKFFFTTQLLLAKKYKKSVIVHNREAKQELLPLLNENWDDFFSGRMVIHCCEPEADLLDFVKAKKIYLGVDGDITYSKKKQEFIGVVPLNRLVLETDSPFLVPEPLKSQKIFPNQPENIRLIALEVARITGKNVEKIKEQTMENGRALFNIGTSPD